MSYYNTPQLTFRQLLDSKCYNQVFKKKKSCGGCIEPFKKDKVDPNKPQCVCYYRGACKKLGDCQKPC
uniref:Uncharacterized protein n=1 Tax=Romanomermis culicivorax TaxID=13658 RepID=A0A915I2D6_ROMCU